MSEKILCEKCKTEMLPIDPCKPLGMKCPKCGWGWVTSYIEPYVTDPTDYSLVIFENKATPEKVKIVSKITGLNYLESKNLLEMTEATVLTGKAAEIMDAKRILADGGISFKISPDFPY